MRLTRWTDYALRVLMYCADNRERERSPTIAEIADLHDISRSHLMKVVMSLSAQGWLVTTRGRGGGLHLLRDPQDISIGQVVRSMEPDFDLVECFVPSTNQCVLSSSCQLKKALAQATQAFLTELDGVLLSDLVRPTGVVEKPVSGPKSLSKPKPARSTTKL